MALCTQNSLPADTQFAREDMNRLLENKVSLMVVRGGGGGVRSAEVCGGEIEVRLVFCDVMQSRRFRLRREREWWWRQCWTGALMLFCSACSYSVGSPAWRC